jgi:hypothetical protein
VDSGSACAHAVQSGVICSPFVRFAHLSLAKFYYYYSGGEAHHDALTELARENLMLKHQLQSVSQEVAVYVFILFQKRPFYVSLHLVHLSIYFLYLSHIVLVQSLCLSFRALSIAHTPSVYLVSLCIPHTWLASETILIVQTKGKTTSQIY